MKKINSDYVELELIRNGSEFSTVVPFESMDKLIGIIIKPDLKITTKKYGFFESIGEGYDEAYWKLNDYIYQFGYLFTKEGASQLGGFGTIGSFSSQVGLEKVLGNDISFNYFSFHEFPPYTSFGWRTYNVRLV